MPINTIIFRHIYKKGGNPVKRKKPCKNVLCKETQKHQHITRGYVFLPVLPVLTSCTVGIHNGSGLCRLIDKVAR